MGRGQRSRDYAAEMMDTNVKTSKRVLCAQDLSCFGHTSLMAEIAILYRLGIQVLALPTALLSANTDFEGYQMLDTTREMEAFIGHWQRLGMRVDAIHSGFLASPRQAELLSRAINMYQGGSCQVLVDPVFGDSGKLYECFDHRMVDAMRDLIKEADIITPNVTEAAFLLDEDPADADVDATALWAERLAQLGPRHVVISSAPAGNEHWRQTLHYDAHHAKVFSVPFPVVDGAHPGSGDCFAAFLLAGIVSGYGIYASLRAATRIMTRALLLGTPPNRSWREGIALEQLLGEDLRQYYQER